MNKTLIFIILLLGVSFISEAGPALPARIGGSVTVNGVRLTHATSAGFVFTVTGKDGKRFFSAADDKKGLNKKGIYIIDIPLYDPDSQPEGAKPGSSAVVHVYKNSAELKVVKPLHGEFIVGKGGTITSVDLVILIENIDSGSEKYGK